MNVWKKAGILLLAAGLMAGIAGCGADKGAPAKSAASGAPAKKELKVACIATYPPFVYKDTEGKIIGFDVDITKAVAKELGHRWFMKVCLSMKWCRPWFRTKQTSLWQPSI